MSSRLVVITYKIVFWLILLLVSHASSNPRPGSSSYAFTRVNVIPMNRNGVIADQTVIIQNGTIASITSSKKAAVPADAIRISGEGMYLMPGLADLHVHLHNENDAKLFLINGVTTIRNMRGTPLHFVWRKEVQEGKRLAPTIYTCGPILDGTPPSAEHVVVVENAGDAEAAVRKQKEMQVDCLKIYNRLSSPAYEAIIEAAARHKIPVTGHVPRAVGLPRVLETRQQSIEHLTGYITALRAMGKIGDAEIRKLAKDTREAGVSNCVTLIAPQKLIQAQNIDQLRNRTEVKFIAPALITLWGPTKDIRLQKMKPTDYAGAKEGYQVLKKIVRSLRDEGAPIVLGTDAPNPYVVPGFSTHEELANLVDAGLTPFEAIAAGTREAARFLGSREFGTIEEGRRADLILLNKNPLKDIRNTRAIAGVMVRGTWLSEKDLSRMLQEISDQYQKADTSLPAITDIIDAQSVSRFDIMRQGVKVGEELLAITTREILSTVSTSHPFPSIYKVRIRRDSDRTEVQFESERPEGHGNIDLQITKSLLRVKGRLPAQPEWQHMEFPLSDQSFVSLPLMASKVLLAERLRAGEEFMWNVKEVDFPVFANKGFEIRDRIWKIKSDKPGEYRIRIQSKYGYTGALLIVDGAGMPMRYETGDALEWVRRGRPEAGDP